MARDMPHDAKILQEEIRKQFGSASTSRYAHSLPFFQVEHRTPQRFTILLSELDRAEDGRTNAGYTKSNGRG